MADHTQQLNRQSPLALYYQLKRILIAQIEDGIYQAGDQLPSENELSQEYHVSRHVVRQALKDLIAEGRILSQQGSGYFVNKKRVRIVFPRLGSHTANMGKLGFPTRTMVVRQEKSTVPDFVAERILSAEEDEAIVIERVTYLSDEPACYIRAFYPLKYADVLLNTDLDNISIYGRLEGCCSLVPERAETVVSVVFADEHQSALLQIREGMPLLFIGSFTWSSENELFEYSSGFYRVDRFELEITQP